MSGNRSYWAAGRVPWHRVWEAFGDASTAFKFQQTTSGARIPSRPFDTAGGFGQWLSVQDENLRAVYMEPPADRFLIVDIDVRDKLEKIPGIGCQHPIKAPLCATCWPFVAVAIYWVERAFRPGLVKDAGLVVFTGNNGVHIWYPLRTPAERLVLADEDVRICAIGEVRTTIEQALQNPLDPCHDAIDTILAAVSPNWPLDGDSTSRLVDIDGQVLRAWHEIRFPMSLHSASGQPGYILGPSDRPEMLPAPGTLGDPVQHSLQVLDQHWLPPAPSEVSKPVVQRQEQPKAKGRKQRRAAAPHSAAMAAPVVIAETPVSKGAGSLLQRTPTTYIRMGKLEVHDSGRPLPGKRAYGTRLAVPLPQVIAPGALANYSLIIPALSETADMAGLVRRYFGLLDLDTDFAPLIAARTPIFSDVPGSVLQSSTALHQAKMLFAQRLRTEDVTIDHLADVCAPFGRLLAVVEELVHQAGDRVIVYYSGGAGFRVLFDSPQAWRLVKWEDSKRYAANYRHLVLQQQVLSQPPLGLSPGLCRALDAYVDEGIYQSNKGVKPDVLAHFETDLWPQRVTEGFRQLRFNGAHNVRDDILVTAIEAFWRQVLTHTPPVDQCQPM